MSKGYDPPGLLVEPPGMAEEIVDPDLLIIDTRRGADYAAGHISGAVHLDLMSYSLYDTSDAALTSFQDKMARVFSSVGLSQEKRVVFYEEYSGMVAARGVWLLEYLGHARVGLLDGGLKGWREAGLPEVREEPVIHQGDFDAKPDPGRVATWQQIAANLGDPDVVLLDVRSYEEHVGTKVRAARGGAIPRSLHIEWLNNLDGQGRFRPVAELRALYEGRGVTADKEIITYCQGGFRSAHTHMALRLIGYPKVRNYVASWGEWGNRADLPVQKGVP